LGGGGARGGIHIGVLKVLEEHEVPVDCVAGTSIGALIGALYALTLNAKILEQRLLEYLQSETFRKARFNFSAEVSSETKAGIFNRIASFIKKEFLLTLALSRPYLISREHFLENLRFFLREVRIEDTRIPFAAVATDLETGEEVILREGPLLDAVYASCAYPGVVEAARLRGRILVDGGVISMVPVEAARQLGADVVIAVNAERRIDQKIEGLSGIETLFRADDIMGAELTRCKTQGADVLIFPGLGDTRWYHFHKAPEFISVGEEAAREKIPEILGLLEKRRRYPFFTRGSRPG